jgi:predicted Zn-dependent peptidase
MLNMIHDYFRHDAEYEEYVPPASQAPKSVTVQQNKDSVNVLFGQALPNIGRAHKDFIPLNIAAAVLGYGFHGMLMTRVRIRDGLTYGIEAHISPGIFQVGATFPPRNLERGVNDIKGVLADWRSSITEQEFKIQKERLKLMPITLSDNPATYVRAQHTFLSEDRINACSYQDVLNAFDKHIDLQNLVQIRVG